MSGWGEQLDPGPWWRAKDGRRGIGIATIVVLTLVVAAFVVAGHGSSPDASGPTPGPVVQTEITQPPLNLDFELLRRCPAGLKCLLTSTVPPGTTAAVASYLPGSYERRAETLTDVIDHRLQFRAVNAVLGAVELLVIVSIPDAARPDAAITADPHPGASIRYARRQVGGFEVQVQFTGPPGTTPPVQRARDLAGDPRLLAMV